MEDLASRPLGHSFAHGTLESVHCLWCHLYDLEAFPLAFRTPPAPAIVLALVASSALTLRGSSAEHRALLSNDLFAHQAKRTRFNARVIVHGTDAELDALAYRHKLQILRRLEGAAVLFANSDELSALPPTAASIMLSGDAEVRPSMSVSIKSTAADQTWAGSAGLLGIGAIAGVTGKGIGVAVIDSGISPHTALANKVVANVSFVTGDPRCTDAFGHGTHVAGIIAGTARRGHDVTPLYNGGIAPGAQADQRSRARRRRHRPDERRHRRHRLGRSPTARATTSASSTCRSAIR